jgi:hypothetical protein
MGETMTPNEPKPDPLEIAFQRSRSAITDDGFSQNVERRVLRWRRRRRLARLLPFVMAIVSIIVAAAYGGFAVPALTLHMPELPDLAALGKTFGLISAVLAKFGIRPWMACAGVLVLFLALAENRREQRLALRL